jgi:phosphomannomutase
MLRFGTDGVRGVAFTELTEQYVAELGLVAARELGVTKVLVGRDTRESGKQLETALANGLLAGGVSVELLGVAPTPAIAFLAAKRGCASAAITASHNPYLDNGVKLFANGGVKLSDAQQDAIESHMTGSATAPAAWAVSSFGFCQYSRGVGLRQWGNERCCPGSICATRRNGHCVERSTKWQEHQRRLWCNTSRSGE